MTVWTAKFPGHYGGGSAVVVADNLDRAQELLARELGKHGLWGKDAQATILPLSQGHESVTVLHDGDE